MAFYRCGGGGIPSSLKTDMNAVLNKKFGTSTTYDPAGWPDDVNLLGKLPEKTVSGTIAHITDGADEVPLKSWEVEIAPTLTGVSSVDVVQTGKNLSSVSEYQNNPWTFWGTNFANMVNVLNTLKSGTYTISWDFEIETAPDTGEIQYGLPYIRALVGGNYVNLTSYSISTASSVSVGDIFHVSASFTLTAERVGNVTNCYLYCDRKDTHSGSTGRGSYNLINAQIEVGNTATAYEPYTAPTQYTASLGRTIYGGTAEVVNGTGTDGYAKNSMSSAYLSGLSSYIGYEASTYFFNNHPTIWVRNWNYQTAKIRQAGGIGCVCNYFPVSMNNTDIISTQNRIYFDVNGKGISDVAGFIAFVQNLEANDESLDIVYELETKTDFTFTPITPTPETALGTNNFWADEGDSEVTYRADINLALGGQ